MQKTIDFIKDLAGTSTVEINDLTNVIDLKTAWDLNNVYFCAGLDKKSKKRCADDDIKTKRYFVVDIDIRLDYYKKIGTVLTQKEVDDDIKIILDLLDNSVFNEYSYAINSGNGLHLFYTGTERAIDKGIYSDGVKWIYEGIDNIIKDTIYRCDTATHNIARIMRIPGTYNPRKKKDYYDLGKIRSYFVKTQPQESLVFDGIEDFAKKYRDDRKKEKKDLVVVKKIVKENKGKVDNIWAEINTTPVGPIAEDIFGVTMGDQSLDNVALKENRKNMGAYWRQPTNVLVNTGSSMITTNKEYYTAYELVYYEHTGKDAKATVKYFEDNYGIKSKKKENIIIEKREYNKIGYVYPNSAFDAFDCFMSGELVTIVAESNSGKTTFAMDIIQANANKKKKGFYINLEFAIETMRQSRWLWLNGKSKRNITDLDPLSAIDKQKMDSYVEKKLKQFDYYNSPEGIELQELVELIAEKYNDGYGLIVIDTFSRIRGNLDQQKARTSQNKSMEVLQELAQNLGVAIVLLHHTNKAGIFEGSQKIMDLSNVFIIMTKEEDGNEEQYRKFMLTKDKYITSIELDIYYKNQEYILD